MNLYKVTINMPVNATSYYVGAASFDEAAQLAMDKDQSGGGHNGGVDAIEVVGNISWEDGNVIMSREAVHQVTLPNL